MSKNVHGEGSQPKIRLVNVTDHSVDLKGGQRVDMEIELSDTSLDWLTVTATEESRNSFQERIPLLRCQSVTVKGCDTQWQMNRAIVGSNGWVTDTNQRHETHAITNPTDNSDPTCPCTHS